MSFRELNPDWEQVSGNYRKSPDECIQPGMEKMKTGVVDADTLKMKKAIELIGCVSVKMSDTEMKDAALNSKLEAFCLSLSSHVAPQHIDPNTYYTYTHDLGFAVCCADGS